MGDLQDLGAEILEHLKLYRSLGIRLVAKPAPRPTPARVAEQPTTGIQIPGTRSLFTPQTAGIEDLHAIRADLGDCRRCKLAPLRKHIVFGAGNPNADLMFVGEAPGADEDEQGLPFVGRAGQMLTRIIQAIQMRREDVYICNILKCRPPGNRSPEGDEITACQGFLFRQVAAVRPRVICALGGYAAQALLGAKEPISRLRGHFIDFHGAMLMATFHPSYLLRNPAEKRKVWEDVQKIRDYLRPSPDGEVRETS